METAPGLDEDRLKDLVTRFYARVRQDPDLGPVFNDAIEDWPAHLGQLTDFWPSVMLRSGRYQGNPMMAHMKHQAKLTPALFARWLELWTRTTAETMPEPAAAALQDRAARIARSLQMALFPSTH